MFRRLAALPMTQTRKPERIGELFRQAHMEPCGHAGHPVMDYVI
jgi:hypothetical protein